ncbi:flagellar hook-length control protein FliK [Litoreibacter janthinus]|nr:flagellar hook-length control protein FliK [Litoreibacter janthinus]
MGKVTEPISAQSELIAPLEKLDFASELTGTELHRSLQSNSVPASTNNASSLIAQCGIPNPSSEIAEVDIQLPELHLEEIQFPPNAESLGASVSNEVTEPSLQKHAPMDAHFPLSSPQNAQTSPAAAEFTKKGQAYTLSPPSPQISEAEPPQLLEEPEIEEETNAVLVKNAPNSFSVVPAKSSPKLYEEPSIGDRPSSRLDASVELQLCEDAGNGIDPMKQSVAIAAPIESSMTIESDLEALKNSVPAVNPSLTQEALLPISRPSDRSNQALAKGPEIVPQREAHENVDAKASEPVSTTTISSPTVRIQPNPRHVVTSDVGNGPPYQVPQRVDSAPFSVEKSPQLSFGIGKGSGETSLLYRMEFAALGQNSLATWPIQPQFPSPIIELSEVRNSSEVAAPTVIDTFSTPPARNAQVSQPAGHHPVEQSSLPEHVNAQIRTALATERGHDIEVRLSPDDLGRIRIVLSPKDGGINVSVFSERNETLDLIRRNSNLLENSFSEAGYEGATFTFEQDRSGREVTYDNVSSPSEIEPIGDDQVPPYLETYRTDDSLDLRL